MGIDEANIIAEAIGKAAAWLSMAVVLHGFLSEG